MAATTPVISSPADFSTQPLPLLVTGQTSPGALVDCRDDAGLLVPATLNPVIAGSDGVFSFYLTSLVNLGKNAGYVCVGGQVTDSTPVPTLVQHTSSTANPIGVGETGNNFKFTLPNAVLSGNAIILGIAYPTSGTLSATPITDTNGTWPTTPSAVKVDTASNVNLAIFVLPNATAGIHTITAHFTAAIIPFQYSVSEFYNIDTASPVNGSAGSSAVTAPNISSGSFTPGNNNANGGNLIWSHFWNDSNPGTGHQVTTFAPGSGFTLLDADIAWHTNANVQHATQYMVQTTSAAINPGMTATMTSANDNFNGLSIALKAASAGTAPASSGIRIAGLRHFTNNIPGTSMTLQAPAIGNLIVVIMNESFVISSTSVTDNHSNTYTKVDPSGTGPQFWIAGNATPGNDLKITVNASGTPATTSFSVYDILNAAASPIGATAGVATTGVNNLTSISNFPTLTPTQANGLTIAAGCLGQGPCTGFYTGAPAGAVFDFVNYTGQADFSQMNNSDIRGHVYTNSTAVQNWNWVITSVASNNADATAVHFKE